MPINTALVLARALAPVPPPPEIVTVGAPRYPTPWLVRVIPVRLAEIVAEAKAPVPPPPVRVTVGATE